MTVRQRILALKLLEMQKKQPDFYKKLGVEIKMKEKEGEKSGENE